MHKHKKSPVYMSSTSLDMNMSTIYMYMNMANTVVMIMNLHSI